MPRPSPEFVRHLEFRDGGSVNTCRNPKMDKPMENLAACVGVFSHWMVDSEGLKDIQKLRAEVHVVYSLIRPNDTRWADFVYLQCFQHLLFCWLGKDLYMYSSVFHSRQRCEYVTAFWCVFLSCTRGNIINFLIF